ncbi:beta-1-3-galactosyltransferase 5-like, partial [Brachionus plicatilis]
KATFVMKIDDDVFVNIKSLSKHLVEKFSIEPKSSKFIYCNINEMAYPMRKNASKWYVDADTYPFTLYPKYCEGFAYITNVATMELMHEQSKIIPRFWIDDVYFTGLLLHGIPGINWFDFKNELKWSYYDFWDLGNTLKIYEFIVVVNIAVTQRYLCGCRLLGYIISALICPANGYTRYTDILRSPDTVSSLALKLFTLFALTILGVIILTTNLISFIPAKKNEFLFLQARLI